MVWVYKGIEFRELSQFGSAIGFVYLIENIESNRKYIGKKNLYFMKSRMVKKKKKRYKEESDWLTYYGSSEELKEEVSLYGEDRFKREILHLCYSKAEMSYLELAEQMSREVLLKEEYYNNWVSARVRTAHLKTLQK
jgi:hypothetical protein